LAIIRVRFRPAAAGGEPNFLSFAFIRVHWRLLFFILIDAELFYHTLPKTKNGPAEIIEIFFRGHLVRQCLEIQPLA